jgi:predicted transcriptional regulator
MIIGDRLRVLREQKRFSQGDIEKQTGLLRAYISRVENGHTVPSFETLEKFVGPSKFRCMNFSMMARSRRNQAICRSAKVIPSCSGARVKMREFWRDFANS